MLKKFEISQTKIKGGCQLGRKVVIHNSKSDLPLTSEYMCYQEVKIKYCDARSAANSNDEKLPELTFAVINGNIENVENLIDNGADVNVKDLDGYTPLIWAAFFGEIEILENLLLNGAQINAKSGYDGYTAMIWAAKNGHARVAKLLIGINPNKNVFSNQQVALWSFF